jgi:hypothetical protein
MKKACSILLVLAALFLFSCDSANEKDIVGRWKVVKQISGGEEIESVNTGVVFNSDGTLTYEWRRDIGFRVPPSYYRVSADTLYWSTPSDSGKININWEDNHLILVKGSNEYTVLERVDP